MTKEKSIAVVSMVRNDSFFADKWITYYGSQFGYENLYLFVDGMDRGTRTKGNDLFHRLQITNSVWV